MSSHNPQVNERDWNLAVISLRLRGAEAVRFWNLLDKAKEKNPYIDKSHVIRELLGLDPPRILTAKDVEHFRQIKVERPPTAEVE